MLNIERVKVWDGVGVASGIAFAVAKETTGLQHCIRESTFEAELVAARIRRGRD